MYDVRFRCSRALRGGCGANANGMSWSRKRRNAAYVRCTMYDVRCTIWKFPRLRANLAKFAVLLAYLLYHGKRMRNRLNEPGENFLGTRVQRGRSQGKRIRKCVCLCTMYDLLIMCALRRFFFGSLMYAEIPLEPSSCRPPVVMIFDAYKRGYQSIRLLSLLITFSQMRLP